MKETSLLTLQEKKGIMKEYYKQLYAYILDNADEMVKCLEILKLLKLLKHSKRKIIWVNSNKQRN